MSIKTWSSVRGSGRIPGGVYPTTNPGTSLYLGKVVSTSSTPWPTPVHSRSSKSDDYGVPPLLSPV